MGMRTLAMSISVVYALFAFAYFLLGFSMLLAGAYPAIPAHGRGRAFKELRVYFVSHLPHHIC